MPAHFFNNLATRCRVRVTSLTLKVGGTKLGVRCVLFSSYCVSSIRITCRLHRTASRVVTDPARVVTCKFPCRGYNGCLLNGASCGTVVGGFRRFCDGCVCPCNATTMVSYHRVRGLTLVIGRVRGGGGRSGNGRGVRTVSNCCPALFCSFNSCVHSVYSSGTLFSGFATRLGEAIPCGYRAARCCSTFANTVPVQRCSNVAASRSDRGAVTGACRSAT